ADDFGGVPALGLGGGHDLGHGAAQVGQFQAPGQRDRFVVGGAGGGGHRRGGGGQAAGGRCGGVGAHAGPPVLSGRVCSRSAVSATSCRVRLASMVGS